MLYRKNVNGDRLIFEVARRTVYENRVVIKLFSLASKSRMTESTGMYGSTQNMRKVVEVMRLMKNKQLRIFFFCPVMKRPVHHDSRKHGLLVKREDNFEV